MSIFLIDSCKEKKNLRFRKFFAISSFPTFIWSGYTSSFVCLEWKSLFLNFKFSFWCLALYGN